MKLIIDISNELYSHILNDNVYYLEDGEELYSIVKNSIPQNVGHWISTYGNVKCSVCGSVKDSRDVGKATHYCDFCGARMVEPQESEEQT
jgi:hypothetical protein